MASPHLAEQVGRVLDGRYRVVAPIGTGASAAVYLADDTTLRRRVALKVLHAALAGDQGFLKRFQAEAHTAAALSHPHIMRVLDWGEAENGPFLVLEYLGGGSLRSVLDRESKLSLEQTVHVGIQAARALEYAHRRGLVHRDIKPGNLLFDEEERLAVADFGLARALAEAAWTEPGGAVLGTARYAAPEQVRGRSLDGKADVYALGLVLFEAVCGYVPFSADTTIATLMARLDTELTLPEELGPLAEVIASATRPDHEDRVDAGQLVDRLEQVAAELPKPERLVLPGAVALDVGQIDGLDQTMLPTAGAGAPATNAARPIPTELTGRSKRRVVRKRSASRASDARTGTSERPSRRLSWRKALVASALTLAVLGVGGAAYALYYNLTGQTRVVPVLENLTADGARSAAQQADVKVSIDGEGYSETVPVGITFDQVPAVGAEIDSRESVHIKVSKGPAPRPVVDVRGQSIDQARPALEARDFVVKTENRFDETAPAGKVLGQLPNQGELPKGSEVTLTLSAGPRPREVPEVKGKSYDEAVALITAQQLKVTRRDDFSNDVPIGQVVGSTPGPHASVARDGTVTIIVSKGPELVAIPNIGNLTVAGATAALEQAGFKVTNVYGPPGGRVFDTGPPVGTKVPKGSQVSLYTR